MDHKPLEYAFKQKPERQARQLDFIAQITTDIRHVEDKRSIAADLLSKTDTINTVGINYVELTMAESTDEEFQSPLNSSTKNSLILKPFILRNASQSIYCDTFFDRVRPFITKELCQKFLHLTHDLSHPGTRAAPKLMTE